MRRLLFIITIIALCLVPIASSSSENHVIGHLTTGGEDGNVLRIDRYGLELKGTDKNGATYFCLPAYVRLTSIDQGQSNAKILLSDGTLMTDPSLGEEQDILVDTGDGNPIPWKICFLKSENLSAVFLDTKDVPISDIDHDIYSVTSMRIISPVGKTTYTNSNTQIKGRGNATWRGEKRPYELKLPKKSGLCGMSESKKWCLLANYFEPTKMYNKLAFDLSSDIGMEYAIESDWVDLYADGEYLGNYLLCREPNIGPSDLDIGSLESMNDPYFSQATPYEDEDLKGFAYDNAASPEIGGYLIEKNTDSYYGHKICGFKTPYNYFTIKSPNNASVEQVSYIRDFVNKVDGEIRNNAPDMLSYIDLDSFTRRFLVEELFFNNDAFVASYYFYKKPGEDALYAGPVWDYDGTVGEDGGVYDDYNGTILNQKYYILEEDLDFRNPLDWDVLLYEDDDYRDYLVEVYAECLPVFTDLVENRIDDYYARIEASVKMDYAIWRRGWGAGHYEDTSDNVRYAKYFLAHRISYLCRKWDIPDPMDEALLEL